jgi:hypothetical protein
MSSYVSEEISPPSTGRKSKPNKKTVIGRWQTEPCRSPAILLKNNNLKLKKKSHILKLFLFSVLDYCLIQAV